MTSANTTTRTLSLQEWDEASTEQRSEWLAQGLLVSEADAETLKTRTY